MKVKTALISSGMLLGVFSAAIGGWSQLIIALCVFMLLDYIMGLVTAICKKSLKTSSGGLSSNVAWTGLAKKVFTLFLVIIGHQIDLLIGVDYVRDAICWTYILNELLSIIESCGLLGMPMPKVISNVVDLLKEKDISGGDKDA